MEQLEFAGAWLECDRRTIRGGHGPYPRSADALDGPSHAIVRRAIPCLSIEADLREIPLGRTLRDLAGEGAGAPREASLLPYPPA